MKSYLFKYFFLSFALFGLVGLNAIFVYAQSSNNDNNDPAVKELQDKIRDRNAKIQQLEKEIATYQSQVQETSKQASSLQSVVKTLDISGKQLSTEISLAENNINKTELSISELGLQIGQLEGDITTQNHAIAETIREMNENDNISIMETLLASRNVSDIWNNLDALENFQTKMRSRVAELGKIQSFLNDKKSETEKKKTELQSYKSTLADKKQLVDVNKKQKSNLLAETKNKQAEYNRILVQKTAEQQAFQKELFDFESELHIAIDKSKIATAGKGVLRWPVDNPFITQYFGRTADAQRLYVSGSHNGIDLRATLNTPIKAALTGIVKATGNTDAQAGCYSYGKWVLIEHNNGLSTLYGHLNLIKVAAGQSVATGEIIGYSGQTGYATGPHLHFTVYASQGVVVQRYATSINCKNVSIPIADPKAYLDPMLYL